MAIYMGDNPTVVELERKLAAAERDLAEAKAECLDVYGKLAISSEMAAQYIATKVELERDLAAATARATKLEAALEKISASPNVLYWIRRIARVALDGQTETGSV